MRARFSSAGGQLEQPSDVKSSTTAKPELEVLPELGRSGGSVDSGRADSVRREQATSESESSANAMAFTQPSTRGPRHRYAQPFGGRGGEVRAHSRTSPPLLWGT